jgi:hypothetical protein
VGVSKNLIQKISGSYQVVFLLTKKKEKKKGKFSIEFAKIS